MVSFSELDTPKSTNIGHASKRSISSAVIFAVSACLLTFTLFKSRTALVEPYGIAVLQGLDKVTARTSTFDSPIGTFVEFGTLKIIARKCEKRPPEETPESAVFLDISEIRPSEPPSNIYRGWMFASSPALAAMEHPVYDVWVLDCKMRLNASPSSSNETSR